MSAENLELVVGLQPPPEADLAQRMRDENFAVSSSGLARFFHPDFECTVPRFDSTKTYTGMDGLRALWLDWLAPWATYRSEIEDAIDLGDRVLVLVHDFGCHDGSTQQIEQRSGAVWTVRDGKVAHVAFYPTRTDALEPDRVRRRLGR
jgi:ketosteroid isomerase-like protein